MSLTRARIKASFKHRLTLEFLSYAYDFLRTGDAYSFSKVKTLILNAAKQSAHSRYPDFLLEKDGFRCLVLHRLIGAAYHLKQAPRLREILKLYNELPAHLLKKILLAKTLRKASVFFLLGPLNDMTCLEIFMAGLEKCYGSKREVLEYVLPKMATEKTTFGAQPNFKTPALTANPHFFQQLRHQYLAHNVSGIDTARTPIIDNAFLQNGSTMRVAKMLKGNGAQIPLQFVGDHKTFGIGAGLQSCVAPADKLKKHFFPIRKLPTVIGEKPPAIGSALTPPTVALVKVAF